MALALNGCGEPRLLGGPETIRVKTPEEMKKRGFLGLEFAPSQSTISGATVRFVLPDSPAEQAGIAVGDRLVQLDGKEVRDADDFFPIARKWKPGQVVLVTVLRGEKELEIKVALMTFQEMMQLQTAANAERPTD